MAVCGLSGIFWIYVVCEDIRYIIVKETSISGSRRKKNLKSRGRGSSRRLGEMKWEMFFMKCDIPCDMNFECFEI